MNKMQKLYLRNQIFYILISLPFLIYFGNNHFSNTITLKKGHNVECLVIKQNCHSYKVPSSIDVKYNNKKYSLFVGNQDCEKYLSGSKIVLFYNDNNDTLINPLYVSNDKMRFLIVLSIFILLIIPWKYLKNKFFSNNEELQATKKQKSIKRSSSDKSKKEKNK